MSKRFQLKVIAASLANLLVLSYIVYLAGYNFLFLVPRCLEWVIAWKAG